MLSSRAIEVWVDEVVQKANNADGYTGEDAIPCFSIVSGENFSRSDKSSHILPIKGQCFSSYRRPKNRGRRKNRKPLAPAVANNPVLNKMAPNKNNKKPSRQQAPPLVNLPLRPIQEQGPTNAADREQPIEQPDLSSFGQFVAKHPDAGTDQCPPLQQDLRSKKSSKTIKDKNDLRIAGYKLVSLDKDKDLPADLPVAAQALIQEFRNIMMYSNETLPEVIHQELKKVFPQTILPHTLLKHKHLKKGVALHELKMLQKIIQASDACTSTAKHEDVWNFSVHYPMLCLAFEDYGTKMQVAPVMSACMIADVADTAFKKVDFCILIKPASPENVERIVEAQSANLLTINQTNAVRHDMIAISCKTEVDVAATTGEAQLAMWTKGGLNRACLLLKKPKGTSPGAPPLPILRVRNNEWYLLFAYYDNSERLVILSEQVIGSTRNLCNIYRLLRCLRLLADWVEDEFREYIDTVLVPGAMKCWVED